MFERKQIEVLILVGLLSGFFGYFLSYITLQPEISRLRQNYEALNATYQQLSEQSSALETRVNELSEEVFKTRSWTVIKTHSGSGDDEIGVYVRGEVWRITWTATAEQPMFAMFCVMVYPLGESDKFIAYSVAFPRDFSLINPQADVIYIVGHGYYTIKVLAANIQEWNILVESYQ